MPIQCPTCSRINPADAAYCYYDGRGLSEAAGTGPLSLGTMSFPLPFSFSDGHGCTNYNQLVLACDRRWIEARNYLLNGTWKSFFGAIGRIDLANLAVLSSKQGDPDVGLCHLLERLPADPEALRPPKLALTSTTEALDGLEPGKDYKFDVVIENQGMLMLSGSIRTDCPWLAFGDHQGDNSTKHFQTRDTFTLPVRVVGGNLRAGKNPLEGQIVIDTNGGREVVTVRATVPVRPFPLLPDGNDVLAGALTPREIAVKAKAHHKEAALLFEQGAVKAWYESNGWTYPIRGTQARGKCVLQQFFEALGLTKAPHLEIDTEQIICHGEIGKRLTKTVIIKTAESKFVHAEAHSSQDWIKILPATSRGNSFAVPLRIEVPPCPGEILKAVVSFVGNGQQRFDVPVTLAVELPPIQPTGKTATGRRWLRWSLAGAVMFLCLSTFIALIVIRRVSARNKPNPDPSEQQVQNNPTEQTPKIEAWWDDIPENHLTASVTELQKAAEANRPIFELIESRSEIDRRAGYEKLAAKLPELARDAKMRQALGQFVTECCVYEPSALSIAPLLRGVAHQFPADDSPFPPDDKGEEVERASFWMRVVGDVISYQSVAPLRRQTLAGEVNTVFGSVLDSAQPPDKLKEQMEKALAEQCYHKLLPTAEQSFEQALTLRDILLARFKKHLGTEVCGSDDVKLLALGLSSDNNLWPKLEPIFKSCVECTSIDVGLKLIDVYEKANAELAPQMEALLADKWKAAGNPKLAQADKAGAIRRSMAAKASAAKISPAERIRRLQQLLASGPLSAHKPSGKPLQDSVALAHASTMACILFNKDAEMERFDELIGRIPGREPNKTVEMPRMDDLPPRTDRNQVIDLSAGTWNVQDRLDDKSERDPRRDTYRKAFRVLLKGGELYVLDMRSSDLKPYLRVESDAGAQLLFDSGPNTHLNFSPPKDGIYRLVASSKDKNVVGRFTLQVSKQQIVRFGFPNNPVQGGNAVEDNAPRLNPNDLADLGNKLSKVRIAAFKNLASGLPRDLPYRHAQKIATYLLATDWETPEAELEGVADQLAYLGRSRRMLTALADVIANSTKLAQKRTEAVVGGALRLKLSFERDEDWRLACRKLLLQRALALTGHTTNNDADKTADFLRDLYKEQGLAFGLDSPDFQGQTELTTVMERLIKHVAAKTAQQKLVPAEKTYLEQIEKQLQAARFVARNDLEYTVLLQRVWIKVLVLALREKAPAQARRMMLTVAQDLDKKDQKASNLLDQLRSGEDNILRIWALAHDLKLQ